MKKYLLPFFLVICNCLNAQDGTIIEKKQFSLNDSLQKLLQRRDPVLAKKVIDSVNFFRIVYLSDGLKVIAFVAEPKKQGKYPCIISNRGGSRELAKWNGNSIAFHLGQLASWNYVVVASQYRGNDGGEGKEEFGGKDVNDIMNLVPLLQSLPAADTSRIGIEGMSRGGLMTYLALKRSCRFKAAVVTAGAANLFINTKSRPEIEANLSQLVPDYSTNRDAALKERSAVFWPEQLCKTTPLLLMQGSADWRVLPAESLELLEKLYQVKHPLRFVLFEGADHGITEFREDRYTYMKEHFDDYLRDGKKPPSLEPHGP